MFYAIALICVLLDQATKVWIQQVFTLGESLPVIPQIFHLTYIHNDGAAFGLFASQRLFLLTVSSVVIVAMVIFRKHLEAEGRLATVAYALVLGGAAGNLIDRARFAYVIDFLDFRVWPVFNLADTFVCTGVGVLIVCSLFYGKKDQ